MYDVEGSVAEGREAVLVGEADDGGRVIEGGSLKEHRETSGRSYRYGDNGEDDGSLRCRFKMESCATYFRVSFGIRTHRKCANSPGVS